MGYALLSYGIGFHHQRLATVERVADKELAHNEIRKDTLFQKQGASFSIPLSVSKLSATQIVGCTHEPPWNPATANNRIGQMSRFAEKISKPHH